MLRKQQPSFILNVSSMASYQPTPWMTVYGATKSWLTSFSRGLRYELQGTGVSVSCLCPGGVVTEFAARAGNQSIVDRTKLFQMPAEKAARITVRKTLNGRAEFVPGWYNQLGTLLVKFLPKGLAVSSAGRIFRKKRIHQNVK